MTANEFQIWKGCYKAGWKGIILDAAFEHPAKVSFSLAERIYEHMMLERGWLKPGMTVVDPFAGIGGFAFHALHYGLHFRGVELEEHYVLRAQANIEKWNSERGWRHVWGTAEIVQGDSRKLSQILGTADSSIASPPYAAISTGAGGLNTKPGKAGQQSGRNPKSPSQDTDNRYGESEGQLSRMPEGDVSAAITSPPYEASIRNDSGIDNEKCVRPGGPNSQAHHKSYDSAVSSPPFGQALSGGGINKAGYGADGADKVGERTYGDQTAGMTPGNLDSLPTTGYGNSPVQIGNSTGDTFWDASRLILLELHAVLKPGGIPVEDGKGIDFCTCKQT